MYLDQNETRKQSVFANGECGRPSAIRQTASGFTLTELLVVIAIIAILSAIGIPAAINAVNKSKQAAITMELQQIGNAVENFKLDYGAYPPNCMHDGNNYEGDAEFNIVQSDFERMLRKAFPRHQEPPELIQMIVGNTGTSGSLLGGMSSVEALYFWFGGFSDDTQYPISGPGGPSYSLAATNGEVLEDRNRAKGYEFDISRLGPRTANGVFDNSADKGRYVDYDDPLNPGGTRRINFWQYTPQGSTVPVAYFDVSRHAPVEYDSSLLEQGGNLFAIKKLREGISNPTQFEDIVFANEGKFQILHAGLDDAWGDSFIGFSLINAGGTVENVLLYPTGPFVGDIADTVGNFMPGTLEDAQE